MMVGAGKLAWDGSQPACFLGGGWRRGSKGEGGSSGGGGFLSIMDTNGSRGMVRGAVDLPSHFLFSFFSITHYID